MIVKWRWDISERPRHNTPTLWESASQRITPLFMETKRSFWTEPGPAGMPGWSLQ